MPVPSTLAAVITPAASDSMSSFASSLTSLARSKLNSSYRSGTKDNLSLHRWVLLKNVISKDNRTTSGGPCPLLVSDTPDQEASTDFEEEEVDSNMDGSSMFSFLFPDPGHASEESREEALLSEAHWLDSLLQSLEEDDDSDSKAREQNLDVNCMVVIESGDDHPGTSSATIHAPQLSNDRLVSSAAVSFSVSYPSLDHAFDLVSSTDCSCSPDSGHLNTYRRALDDSEGSVPDAIEDTSDDDSDAVSTPFSRSHTSFSFADPASNPLPGHRHESILYPALDKLFPLECNALPYVYHS